MAVKSTSQQRSFSPFTSETECSVLQLARLMECYSWGFRMPGLEGTVFTKRHLCLAAVLCIAPVGCTPI